MIAEVCIGLRETDEAFRWLHVAIDQKDVTPFLTCDPLFDLCVRIPFESLLERANLA